MEKKILIITLIMIAIVYIILAIYTGIKYHTINPILATIGYVKVELLEKDYAVVQNIPTKTIFAKSDDSISAYMNKQGFTKAEGYYGRTRAFTNGHITKILVANKTPLENYPFFVWSLDEII